MRTALNRPTLKDLIPFADVPASGIIPRRRGGKRLSISTLYRWAQKGVAGVRLKTSYAGGCPCTCEVWIREFFDEIAATRNGQQLKSPSDTAAAAEAEKELMARGAM